MELLIENDDFLFLLKKTPDYWNGRNIVVFSHFTKYSNMENSSENIIEEVNTEEVKNEPTVGTLIFDCAKM